MEYTVNKLGRLAGVSTRTLRYYDEIGILKPARVNSSGYRIYGQKEVDMLQQILFYRELGFNLSDIKEILTSPDFDRVKVLEEHKRLLERKYQLDLLIKNVEKTIAYTEGRIKMSDKEKFEGFKQRLIDENEQKYGAEIREKYGEETVEKSYDNFRNMTQEQYKEMQNIESELHKTLTEAFKTGDPEGPLAQKAADLHKQWITYAWGDYNKDAHAGVAQLYVDDHRFTEYYDRDQPGLAKFLRDAIFIYTGKKID
ncbi:MAG: MerR family transcriptional regulator [Clostridiaceae bacterium]|nr:MerR family transcriptional regulator [Clostridiaceae bacterium]